MSLNGLDSSEAKGIASALHDPGPTPDGGAVAAGNAHRTPTELAQTTAAGEPSGSGGSGVVDSSYLPVRATSPAQYPAHGQAAPGRRGPRHAGRRPRLTDSAHMDQMPQNRQ
jgi:hypothetical protein